ncbi:MAG TPA: hypothetical protein VF968_00940 [Actinomycetota bacterium]
MNYTVECPAARDTTPGFMPAFSSSVTNSAPRSCSHTIGAHADPIEPASDRLGVERPAEPVVDHHMVGGPAFGPRVAQHQPAPSLRGTVGLQYRHRRG